MKLPRLGFLDQREAARDFRRLDPSFRDVVFYSEGPGDWPHLGPVVESLLNDHARRVSYLSSDPTDPGLRLQHELLRSFSIGSGTTRTVLFRTIECRQFVMTLPDLGNMWLKRAVHPVRYVYLFHSTNSTHTVYRKGAFDAYDTIMCVGPYHVDEIRRTEERYGLRPKELVEAGSVKLDTVMREFAALPAMSARNGPTEVLVAPSWGLGSLIEMPIGEDLIRTLVDAGMGTTLRLHPMTVRRHPELPARLQSIFANQPLFRLEQDMSATVSWLRSDVMVSDWSGAATEFAFALGKPLIFVDTPQKIRNPDWQAIDVRGFEDSVRQQIGCVLGPDDLKVVPDTIRELQRNSEEWGKRIADVRSKSVFNVGRSARAIAAHIANS